MKTTLSLLATATYACVFLITPAKVHADPVDYFAGFGSFETSNPDAFLNFNGTNISTSIPGWVVFKSGPPAPFPQWQNNGQAQDGDRHLLLRSVGGSDPRWTLARFDFSISPVALTPGELYELTFWAAGGVATSGKNHLGVQVSNSTRIDFEDPFVLPVATQVDTLDWRQYSMTFIPEGQDVLLTIRAREINAGGTSSMYLDNFDLRHIPEPGSMVLLGVAAGVLGLRRRRSSQLCAGRRTP